MSKIKNLSLMNDTEVIAEDSKKLLKWEKKPFVYFDDSHFT